MTTLALPTRAPSRSESRSSAPPDPQVDPTPSRPPRSLSRPSPPKINIDIQTILQQSTPRSRGFSGRLALQARDSVSVRKRTMSMGAVSARVARQNARETVDSLSLVSKRPARSPSGSARSRNRPSPPLTRTSRSPSPSSSSASQSPIPSTPGHPPFPGDPPYEQRGRTHIPHDSQGTTTSAYPRSSSHSSRSSSPSPRRSHTLPSPPRHKKPSVHSAPTTPALDLDPDDVNARLRLLVNNSYYLPPAHSKPELSPIYSAPPNIKPATSPSAFMEFFRVGKRKERKPTDASGYTSEGARLAPHRIRISSDGSPRSLSSGSDDKLGLAGHGDGYFDLQHHGERTRNRVVVVREMVVELPPPVVRPPFRTTSLQAHTRPRAAPTIAYNDPTTQYDMPPPTHYASYANLRLDVAGITGNVELDQFAPPGEPWNPAPSSPVSARRSGQGMDPQERVWRRAILEQAVDLSLSSTGSEAGQVSSIHGDGSFSRGARVNCEELVEPTTPKSPKSKKSWWGRKDRDTEDTQRRPSTSSSMKDRDGSGIVGIERVVRSLDVETQPPHHAKRELGQRELYQKILPNVHMELEELERERARREMEQNAGLPPPLRPRSMRPIGITSTPATPLSRYPSEGPPATSSLPLTPLSPRPQYRRGEKRSPVLPASEEAVPHEFMPGHSTITKSLSSPLLSDLHETGVDVEEPVPFRSGSEESLDGVAAPSLVLQDPHGVMSLVTSHSFTSGSHYSEEEQPMCTMTAHDHPFSYHEDDGASLERWNPSPSNGGHGGGRPSFDSFGVGRVRSPEEEYPARASSTFGFTQSAASIASPSPWRGSRQDIEVDISGDPMDHLSMMAFQRSTSPSAESRASSVRGYSSALDHTFTGSQEPSVRRPPSPSSASVHSTRARLTSMKSLPGPSEPMPESKLPAPISFFDSVQTQSFLDEDCVSSDSDSDVDEEPDVPFTAHSDPSSHTQTLGRTSLNTARPAPALPTQFRNASQPQLPLHRPGAITPPNLPMRPIRPYDILDRKRPLTNTPSSTPPTSSGGFLSQFKAKPGKSPKKPLHSFASKGKQKPPVSPMVLPEATFEFLRHPHGMAFSLGSGMGTTTGSDAESVEVDPGELGGARSQESLPSLRSSDAASFKHVRSWRQEQAVHDESVRKLDGMLMQHLEAEKDRLRKIAKAAKKKGVNP